MERNLKHTPEMDRPEKSIHDLPIELLGVILQRAGKDAQVISACVSHVWFRAVGGLIASGHTPKYHDGHVWFLASHSRDGPQANLYRWVEKQNRMWDEATIIRALLWGRLDMLKWAMGRRPQNIFGGRVWRHVIASSQRDVLAWFLAGNSVVPFAAFCKAARMGRVDVLTTLVPHIRSSNLFIGSYGFRIAEEAARANQWHVVDWLIARSPCDDDAVASGAFEGACRGGHLALARSLFARGHDPTSEVAAAAAKGGHMRVLKWLASVDCPMGSSVCVAAAHGGHLDVLQWATQSRGLCLVPEVCCEAANGAHWDVLKWAASHGCPVRRTVVDTIAAHGHVEMLDYAHVHGWPWGINAIQSAASKGHIDVLEWARAHGKCLDNADALCSAASNGHLTVIEWGVAHGMPLHKRACKDAARSGHWAVVEWLIEREVPHGDTVFEAAAEQRRLDVLQRLVAHREPGSWSKCLEWSVYKGQLDMVEWIVSRTRPTHSVLVSLEDRCRSKHRHVRQWLRRAWHDQPCSYPLDQGPA